MESIIKYIVFFTGAFLSYFTPIESLLYVVLLLIVADLITGITASFKEGESLKSSKARWSFTKLMVYLFSMFLTFSVCELMGIKDDTAVSIVKVIVWAVIYVEGLSIVENLSRIIPGNKVIGFLHWLLSVEFIKRVPLLADFFKEDKEKFDKHD